MPQVIFITHAGARHEVDAAAGESLMVGDSDNDTQAARAAGCGVVCVPYGYNEGRAPAMLDCDGLVDNINQLAGLVLAQREPV